MDMTTTKEFAYLMGPGDAAAFAGGFPEVMVDD
jgi:hypothetical protein